MILTCPSCTSRYFVADDLIGPAGRTVRCQSCGHGWRATPEEPLELGGAAGEPVVRLEPQASLSGGETEPEARTESPAESLSETPAAELPGAFRARAEQQRRMRRAAAHGVVWSGLASLFVGLMGAAWLFRVEVVDVFPRAAAAYAAIGAPVNRTGLEFEAVGARAMPNDPSKVMVSGAVRNVRDREIQAPPVRVVLLDAHGAEVASAVVRIDAAPVLPGRVQGFAVILADPGARSAGVGVDFVVGAPAVGSSAPLRPATAPSTRPSPSSPSHGEDAAPSAGPQPSGGGEGAPLVHAAPAAPHGVSGLRPATAGLQASPVDAVPVSTGIDSRGSGAVSASDHG